MSVKRVATTWQTQLVQTKENLCTRRTLFNLRTPSQLASISLSNNFQL